MASVADEVTRELGARELQTWVVGSWSIANSCSAAMAGYFSDTFGRRNVIIAGDLIVLLGCILGGTARSIVLLIAAQSMIGFGAGFVFDVFAAVPEMLPNKWRALGAGIVEGGINVPWYVPVIMFLELCSIHNKFTLANARFETHRATISVILANVLTRYASWRWVYYLAILLSFITFKATVLLYWPVSRPKGDFHRTRWEQIKDLDYIGIASITGGIVLLTCGLTWGGIMYPWGHPGSILPILIGLLTIIGGFRYDFTIAKNPMVPLNLFRPQMFRQYLAILIVLFVSGMNFYAMTFLLPLGSSLMFTTDGLEVGVVSLPNTIMQLVAGFIVPLISHKIPEFVPWLTIKWQLVVGMALQATFLGLSALSVAPNSIYAYAFLPAFGVPMFTMVTILSYAIASLHVPHSQLGTALGFLGSFRSTGGAVGNAIFGALFSMLSVQRTAERVGDACQGLGLCPNATVLESLVAETMAYNRGLSGTLLDIEPETRDVLRDALRLGYGQSFRTLFCATIPLSIIAMICSLYIEDPWPYMNNHVQFRMYEHGVFKLRNPDDPALTGARVLWKANPKVDEERGTELVRVGSQGSQVPLNDK